MTTAPIPVASYLANLQMNFYDLADVRTTGNAIIEVTGGDGSISIPIAQGVRGLSTFAGTTIPTSSVPSTAVTDDLYIYTGTTGGGVTTGDVLRKAGDGTWSVVGTVRGAQGTTGTTGGVGPTGPSSGIRPASDYDDTVAPTTGQRIAWNGTKYAPDVNAVIIVERSTSNQAIASGAVPALVWDTQVHAVNASWSSMVNPSRVTIGRAGNYKVDANCALGNDARGVRGLDLRVNGTDTYSGPSTLPITDSSRADFLQTSKLIRFASADYVEVLVFQNSSATLAAYGTGHNIRLSLQYVSP